MRKFLLHLLVKGMVVIGLVMTTVVLTRAAEVGIVPSSELEASFPTWFPRSLATQGVALIFTAVAVPALSVYWLTVFMTSRIIRKRYPREAY